MDRSTKDNIDDLLLKIQLSEREAEARKHAIGKLKSEIATIDYERKEIETEIRTLKGNVVLKVHSLAEKEIQLRIVERKLESVQEIHEKLEKKIQEEEKSLVDLEKEFVQMNDDFCHEVHKFSSQFGLMASVQRPDLEKVLTDGKSTIIDHINKTQNELKTFDSWLQELNELQKVLRELKQKYDDPKESGNKVETMAEIEQLTVEKERLVNEPHEADDFLRLQADLEVCQRESNRLTILISNLEQDIRKRRWQHSANQQKRQTTLKQKSTGGLTFELTEAPIKKRVRFSSSIDQ